MAFGDFTVVRSTVKRVLNSSGVLAEVAVNTPAFEFNADGTYKGLLVEPAATNLAGWSEVDGGTWSATVKTTSGTILGITAVELTTDVPTFADTPSQDINGQFSQSLHTVSFYIDFASVPTSATIAAFANFTSGGNSFQQVILDAVTKNITVAPATGTQITHVSSTLTQINGTIYKFVGTWNMASVANSGSRVYVQNDTSLDTIRIAGLQVETGSVATSYIAKSVTTTVTRTADDISLSSASSLIGQTQGTIYVEMDWQEFASNPARIILELSANAQNRVVVYQSESPSPELRMFINSDNVIQTNQGVSTSGYTGVKKIAFAYKHNDCALYVDGASASTDTSVDLSALATLTTVDLGQDLLATAQFNGWIRSVALFPTRLSNSQLESLTTL